MSNVIPITASADRAYLEYCAAATLAQSTLARADMEAAGRAWRLWLDIYMSQEQRDFLGKPSVRVSSCK